MTVIRPSRPQDIPAQRQLWALAFGDDGAYVDNFYKTYYQPQRVLVLEEEGAVRAMTAWFDTTLSLPGRDGARCAYLYAVATHPQCRGRGYAGQLLSWADGYFQTVQGFDGVTTVPAQPSLHRFFGANGFRECFTHDQLVLDGAQAAPSDGPPLAFTPVSPQEYGLLREQLLGGLAHVTLPADALDYQAGCCAVSGGGLYQVLTPQGPALVCAEGGADGRLLVKELLAAPAVRALVLPRLSRLLPAFGGVCRCPGTQTQFGMLKWLNPHWEKGWDWGTTAYLGLAFD